MAGPLKPIFDLDGVIINSEPFHQQIEKEMMLDRGLSLTEAEHRQLVGMAGYDMWKILADRYHLAESVDDLRAEKRERTADFLETMDGSVLVPGSIDCLRSFHEAGLTLALASSAGRWYVERIIDRFDIHRFFSAVVTGWDVQRSKPAPDIFLLTAEKLNTDPARCAVIEDSENGVRAARDAGMAVVGYQNPCSITQNLSAADMVIRDFSELTAHRLTDLLQKE